MGGAQPPQVERVKYDALGIVAGGTLRLQNRPAFDAAFAGWPDGPVWASFETAAVLRSPAQNRYWHGVIVKAFSAHCHVGPRQMHDALTVLLLPHRVFIPDLQWHPLHEITIGAETSRLTRVEATNLIERALALAASIPITINERPPAGEDTHFIPHDSPQLRRQQRAMCGALVSVHAHAGAPTCEACAAQLRTYEAMKF